ncbi:MAG: hypothetical protein FJW23_07015 [Acidimicrobiia bacterium]|nr:hypothetical protein [Acidimicrobiia bacterium]
MKHIVLTVGALALVIGLLKLAPATASIEAQATSEETAHPAVDPALEALTTPWGEPNLQGMWVHDVEIPLERPDWVGDREFFTEEEIAALDAQRGRWLDHDYRAERGTPHDVSGAYNAVFHLQKETGKRTSLIIDPPDGKMPARTTAYNEKQAAWNEWRLKLLQASEACKNNEGTCGGWKYAPPHPEYFDPAPFYPLGAVNRADGPEDRGNSERCLAGYLPAGGEGTNFSSGQNGFTRRIVQAPGRISMFYDTGQGQSWQRPTILMNGSPHLPSHVKGWWGDSRGHWEEDTLVIDVTNFNEKTSVFGAKENLHMVERFRRTGPKTLEYTVTMEDPTTWLAPWTARVEYSRMDDYPNRFYTDNRCHEGNYGLPALLRGARIEEAEWKAGKGPHPAEICISGCSEKVGAEEDPDQTGNRFRNPFE